MPGSPGGLRLRVELVKLQCNPFRKFAKSNPRISFVIVINLETKSGGALAVSGCAFAACAYHVAGSV